MNLKELDQTPPMAGFFLLHPFENRGRGWKGLFQALGVFRINALVFLFEGNGQR